MATRLYSRLKELDKRAWFLEDETHSNVYCAIAEKAGVKGNEVVDLAIDGLRSVGAIKAKKIFNALAAVQGTSAITDNEITQLLADDHTTLFRFNEETMSAGKRWLL